MAAIGGGAAVGGGPYRPQEDPTEIERDPLETGALETFDVFALIVNKMIGTGIYSAPATIFMLTGQKWLTLVLFFVGFIHSLLSTTMYLDYASVWPYTGGELIYIDEITADTVEYPPEQPPYERHRTLSSASHGIEPSLTKEIGGTIATPVTEANNGTADAQPATFRQKRQRLLGDGLLPFITFSVLFVAIFNSGTNGLQTGRMVLLAIAAKEPGTPDVHRDVMRLLGVVILTILSLLQYFSARFGRKLNRFLVIVKLLFMLALFLAAMAALKDPLTNPDGTVVNRREDWTRSYPVDSELYFAKALLAVLFSFDGWENATFVTGELPRTGNQRELRKGFYAAVFTVGCTYVIIVGVVLNSLTWEGINAENVYYAPLLSGNGRSAKLAWSIAGAISALGSLNSVIYTFSRVKQVIGQANILPWSNVWKKDDILQRDPIIADTNVDNSIKKTPQGGLILHWTLSVAVIAGTSWIPSTIESVNIPGFIQAYAHCFILMVLGCTYHRLRSRKQALTPPTVGPMPLNQSTTTDTRFQPYKWNHTALRVIRAFFVTIYVLLNLAILIINVIPPYRGSDGTYNAFPGWAFLVTVASIVLFSLVYYFTIFGAAKKIYPSPGTTTRVEKEGPVSADSAWNLLRLAKVSCEVEKDRYFNTRLERVYRFGRRWRIRFYVPGDRRPGPEGQAGDHVNGDAVGAGAASSEPHPPLTLSTFLYWVFGGGRLVDPPDEKFVRWWDRHVGL